MRIAWNLAKAGLAVIAAAAVFHGAAGETQPGLGALAVESATVPNDKGSTMSQADIKLSKIAVVMIGVKDFPKSVAFYRDTLGLAPQGEVPGEFAFFNAGSVMLALSVPHADPKTSPSTVGALEVVFGVDDVTAAYNALRARGVKFINEPRNVTGANWSAVFTDPNGHRLSIFGPQGSAQ